MNTNNINCNNNNMIVSFTDESLDSGLSSDHSGLCRSSLSDASSVAGVSSQQSHLSPQPQTACIEPSKGKEACRNSDGSQPRSVLRGASGRASFTQGRRDRFTDDDEAELDLVVEQRKPNRNTNNLSLLYDYDVVFGKRYEGYDGEGPPAASCSCGECESCIGERKSAVKSGFDSVVDRFGYSPTTSKLMESNFFISSHRHPPPHHHHLPHHHHQQNVFFPADSQHRTSYKLRSNTASPEFQAATKTIHQIPPPITEDPAFRTFAPESAGKSRAANFYQWLNTGNAQTLNRPLSAYEDSLTKKPLSKKGRCDFDLDYRHPGDSLASTITGVRNCSVAQHHRHQLHHLVNFEKSQRLQLMRDRRHQALRQQQLAPQERMDSDRFSVLNPFHKTPPEDSQVSRIDEDDDDDDLGAVLRRHLTRRRRNSDAGDSSVTSLESRFASATIRGRKLMP